MKTIKSFFVLIVAVLTALSANSTWAGEWVLYDSFDAKLIDLDKWFGRISATSGNELRETVREIKGNRLHLLSRGYSRTDIDSGESFSQVQLFFTNPDIVAIKATIKVRDYELVGCGDIDTTSRVRARIVGSFFNTTSDPTPGTQGDVWAQIRLQRNAGSADPPKVLSVRGDIFRCTDQACIGFEIVGEPAELGTVRIGQTVELRLEWDKANNKFIFQRDNETEVYRYYDPSLYSREPSANFRRLEASESVVNCTIQPRPVGFIDAYFDNVFVKK